MFNKHAGIGNEGLKEFETKMRVASFEVIANGSVHRLCMPREN
jgi:hypothetical protein